MDIVKKSYSTVSSIHLSRINIGRAVRFYLSVAVLLMLMVSQGCGKIADGGEGGTQNIEKNIAEESASNSSTGLSVCLAEENIEKGLQSKELVGKEKENMELESIYLELLGIYLKEQLGLVDYDQEIADFGCLVVDEEEQTESQKQKNMGLKYLYLRNDVHVERLNEEDIEILRKGKDTVDGDARDHAMEVVIRTFPICISPMPIEQEEDKAFPYVYDNNVLAQDGEETVTMDTLLLRIATQAEYDEQGEYVDTYKEVQKEKELYELKERMESEMEGLLGEIPIKVFIDSII